VRRAAGAAPGGTSAAQEGLGSALGRGSGPAAFAVTGPGGPGAPGGGAGGGTTAGPGGGSGPGPTNVAAQRRIARAVPASGRVRADQLVGLVTQLQGCLTALPPLQRDFLIFRAGLDGGGTRSLAQLGRALGMSPSRAAAIQRSAVRGLRSASLAGECSGGVAFAYSAGLFASPALLGSPLGALFGPGEGRSRSAPSQASATAPQSTGRTFSEALRDLGGESSPPPLIPALALMLFLAASLAALLREAHRSI
jgi:hypothetical protein